MSSLPPPDTKRKNLVHATKLKVKHTEYKAPDSRIPGHNFAIGLLQTLESRVDELKQDFIRLGNKHNGYSVNKETFISLLTKRVHQGPRSILEKSWLLGINDATLEANISSVFDGVASTGKSTISFDELLAYIIDCSMCGKVGHVDERVPEYDTSGCSILRHLDEITRAKYCPELGKIITAGKTIGLVDSATFQTRSFEYSMDPKDRFPCIYDVDYVPHLNAALCVGTEMSVQFIGLDKGKRLFTIPTNETHQVCAFDRTTSLAMVASRNGDLLAYKVPTHRVSETKFEEYSVLKHHSQSISRILPLEKDGLVATGSADSSVYINDVVTGDILTQFVGHYSGGGVRTLCHVSHLNLMASCAFDTEPLVWMISSAATRSDAFTLADAEMPHIGHVVDMCCVPGTPQLSTVDQHGLIKIWDIRTFKCVQNIRADKIVSGIVDAAMMKWHSLVWDDSTKEVCVVSRRRLQKLTRRIPIKEMEALSTTTQSGGQHGAKSDDAAYCDEYPVLYMAVNPATQTVVTCSEQKVRVWDAFTGRQEILFDRLTAGNISPISCLCVNNTGKCFFLGHRGGRLASHAFSTGVTIFKFLDDGSGNSELLSLNYLSGANAFAAVTWNGCKIYYDQTAYPDGVQSFYPDSSRSIEVKAIHWDPLFSILTCGERTGTIALWESRQNRFTPDSVRSIGSMEIGDAEVNAVTFLTGFSAVAASDNVGRLALFTTAPHPFANRKFGELFLKNREVLHVVFYPPRRLLYCADDKGTLFVVDCASALASVGITTSAASWEGMMNSVGRQGTAPRTVEELVPVRSVKGHSDVITGLQWLPGSALLMSTSIDRHSIAWTLSLEMRGSFDPVAPSGTYEAPFSRPKGTDFIDVPPQDEDLWATEHTPEAVKKPESKEEPKSPDDEAKVTLTSAAKFDEEIRKAAIELESFLTEKTSSSSKEKAQLLTQMDGDSQTHHSKNWKFAPVVKHVGDTGLVSVVEGGDAVEEHDYDNKEEAVATRDVYSLNSVGVECHSLLTPQPDIHQFKRKKHVVDRSGHDVEGDSVPFEVTRDFPLPPNARAERDFLLRQMKDKEEVLAQKALAAEQENPYETKISGSQIDVSASGFAPLPEVRAQTPVGFGAMPRRGREPKRIHPRRLPRIGATERVVSSLLPHELIALRRAPKQKRPLSVLEPARSSSTPPTLNRNNFVDEVDWHVHGGSTEIDEPSPHVEVDRSSLPPKMLLGPFDASHTLQQRTQDDDVGFLTFGVRSINDRLMTPAPSQRSGTQSFNGTFTSLDGRSTSSWSKTHRVDMESFDASATLKYHGRR